MDVLNISRRTLDRYVEDGRLEASKLPTGHRRFKRRDVAALLTPSDASPVEAQRV
ncbi:helix-turn-helix domain-containing protein [Pseudoclavibacter helvolus]